MNLSPVNWYVSPLGTKVLTPTIAMYIIYISFQTSKLNHGLYYDTDLPLQLQITNDAPGCPPPQMSVLIIRVSEYLGFDFTCKKHLCLSVLILRVIILYNQRWTLNSTAQQSIISPILWTLWWAFLLSSWHVLRQTHHLARLFSSRVDLFTGTNVNIPPTLESRNQASQTSRMRNPHLRPLSSRYILVYKCIGLRINTTLLIGKQTELYEMVPHYAVSPADSPQLENDSQLRGVLSG